MGTRKVLAIIKQDPILQDACDRMDQRHKDLKTQLDFIKKQLENAIAAAKKADEPDYGLIEARLKETGALTSYNKDTHHLCIRHEEGSIDLHANESDHPLAGLFDFLGRGH